MNPIALQIQNLKALVALLQLLLKLMSAQTSTAPAAPVQAIMPPAAVPEILATSTTQPSVQQTPPQFNFLAPVVPPAFTGFTAANGEQFVNYDACKQHLFDQINLETRQSRAGDTGVDGTQKTALEIQALNQCQ